MTVVATVESPSRPPSPPAPVQTVNIQPVEKEEVVGQMLRGRPQLGQAGRLSLNLQRKRKRQGEEDGQTLEKHQKMTKSQ